MTAGVRLTVQQRRVVELVRRGWLYKDIAAEMRISVTRVKQHARVLGRKFPGSGPLRQRICEQSAA